MYIEQLTAKSIRNLSEIVVEPSRDLNLLIGKNASGKTAVLEAIYLLSRARSFRTNRVSEVVQREKESLQVSARLHPVGTAPVTTGIEKGNNKTFIRYNGETIRTVSTQARQVPLVLITPDSHQLVTGTPKERRHWLDWAMFHVEPAYLGWWRSYHKSLRQRNILLRTAGAREADEINGWEQTMVKAANDIQRARFEFIERLYLCLQKLLCKGFPDGTEVMLQQGWAEEEDLLDVLSSKREQDCRLGYTRYGPHKADLEFHFGGGLLRAMCSRGQIKLFVNALLIAQAQVYESYSREKPVFLVDDYAAELDDDSQQQLLQTLAEQSAQVFLTSTELSDKKRRANNITMFHVEHGNVLKVVK